MDEIAVELRDSVLSITLNQPDRLNALSPEMLRRIPQEVNEAPGKGARAILITGAGRAFCTGAQLAPRKANGPRDLGAVVEEFYSPLAMALAEAPVPIVSAVNGPTAGAGVGLALGADIILAARSAYFLFAFRNIGLVPDAGATWLVTQSVGRVKALELMLLGERLAAEDAVNAGLVTGVVEDADLPTIAWDAAVRLAQGPTVALGLIRRQVRASLEGSFQDSLAMEKVHQRMAGLSADYAEGVAAFLQKRPADFTGA